MKHTVPAAKIQCVVVFLLGAVLLFFIRDLRQNEANFVVTRI